MFKVESTIVINAPANEVYDWMDHPHKHHDWQHSLIESRQEDDKIVVHRKFLGRRVETHFHDVERVPGKLLRRSGKGAVGMPFGYTIEQSVVFEEVSGGTKLTMTSEVDTKGALKRAVLSSFERVAKNEQETSLAHLKELVEAEEELHEVIGKMPRHQGA